MKYVLMDVSCKKILKEGDSYEELKELKVNYEYKMFDLKDAYLTDVRIFDKTNQTDLRTLRKITRLDW